MRFTTFLVKNLLRRKFRSLLTCVGFAVAVGTTVALLGVSESFDRAWHESMDARGIALVVSPRGVSDQLSMFLDEEKVERVAEVPGVDEVVPSLISITEYVDEEGFSVNLMVQGWQLGSVLFDDIDIVEGRALRPGDTGKAMLGKNFASNANKKVGDTISLFVEKEMNFEVVGIYDSFVVFENGAMTIPLSEAQSLFGREGEVSGFSVKPEPGKMDEKSVEAIAGQINSLTDADGTSLRLEAKPIKAFVKDSLPIQTAHAMAWMTSAIAVVVGSIGVLNTMIMSVVERIREISILRAIGWKKRRVVRMVLGEALILSLVGALIGTVGAIALVKWLTTLPSAAGFIEGTIAPVVIAKGFALAVAVGLLGGAYPAWRAARLLPSEGLRHE
jgi:putative ABC transport system permease protein